MENERSPLRHGRERGGSPLRNGRERGGSPLRNERTERRRHPSGGETDSRSWEQRFQEMQQARDESLSPPPKHSPQRSKWEAEDAQQSPAPEEEPTTVLTTTAASPTHPAPMENVQKHAEERVDLTEEVRVKMEQSVTEQIVSHSTYYTLKRNMFN